MLGRGHGLRHTGALDRGAVREVVDEGVTGGIFQDLDGMVAGLPSVLTLDRARVRARASNASGDADGQRVACAPSAQFCPAVALR